MGALSSAEVTMGGVAHEGDCGRGTKGSEVKSPLPLSGRILGGFQIGRLLGCGGYASCFQAVKFDSGEEVAMKVEDIRAQKQALMREVKLMEGLKDSEYCAQLIDSGYEDMYRFAVMPLYGPSVSAVRRKLRDRRFGTGSALVLGISMLDAIEELHDRGIIHRDLKPDQFLFRSFPERLLVLIDYGLSCSYRVGNSHISDAEGVGFYGTVRYASVRALEEARMSRRDDIISWFYTLLECFVGRLPWPGSSDVKETLRLKSTLTVKEMCGGAPDVMVDVWRVVRRIGFAQRPPYRRLRSMLMGALDAQSGPWDWETLDESVLMDLSPIELTWGPTGFGCVDARACGCSVA